MLNITRDQNFYFSWTKTFAFTRDSKLLFFLSENFCIYARPKLLFFLSENFCIYARPKLLFFLTENFCIYARLQTFIFLDWKLLHLRETPNFYFSWLKTFAFIPAHFCWFVFDLDRAKRGKVTPQMLHIRRDSKLSFFYFFIFLESGLFYDTRPGNFAAMLEKARLRFSS